MVIERPRHRAEIVLSTALGAAAVAVGFLVGRDGSPVWQLPRAAVTAAVTFVAWYAIRCGPTRLRGPTVYLVGVVATVVGVGIGVRHLGAAGWSAVAAAGVLALVSGVGLLVAGAADTVRHAHRWCRLLVAPVVLVVTTVSLWSGIIAVAATNLPPTRSGPRRRATVAWRTRT